MNVKKKIDKVETGVFGADMKVSLINDGPVTLLFWRKVDGFSTSNVKICKIECKLIIILIIINVVC